MKLTYIEQLNLDIKLEQEKIAEWNVYLINPTAREEIGFTAFQIKKAIEGHYETIEMLKSMIKNWKKVNKEVK